MSENIVLVKGESYYDQDFKDLTLLDEDFEEIEFEKCTFTNCNFQGTTFLRCYFTDCEFKKSNFSLVKPDRSKFDNVLFKDSKVVGVNWVKSRIHESSSLNFEDSILDMNVFYGYSLRKMKIRNCKAKDVDFVNCDLSEADLRGTDFEKSAFNNTNLSYTDFRDAKNYSINVLANKLKKTKFSRNEALSLLDSLDIILD